MQAVAQLDHLAGIDIERRTVHGLQHLVGHRGGPGDGQKFPARANGHWWSSLSGYALMLAWRGAISKGPCAVHLCRIVTSPWVLFPDGLGDLTPDRILDL